LNPKEEIIMLVLYFYNWYKGRLLLYLLLADHVQKQKPSWRKVLLKLFHRYTWLY